MKKIHGTIFVANYSYSGLIHSRGAGWNAAKQLIHRVTQQSKDHTMQVKSNIPKKGIFKPVVAFYPFALADISPDARSSIVASYAQPAAILPRNACPSSRFIHRPEVKYKVL